MCSIGIVLAIIMTGINLANYMNVCRNADARISMISDNDGHLPEESNNTPPPNRETTRTPKIINQPTIPVPNARCLRRPVLIRVFLR